jgi:hypothetical protein
MVVCPEKGAVVGETQVRQDDRLRRALVGAEEEEVCRSLELLYSIGGLDVHRRVELCISWFIWFILFQSMRLHFIFFSIPVRFSFEFNFDFHSSSHA